LLGLGIFDRFTKNYFYQKCVRFQKLIPDFRSDFIQPDEQEWLSECHKSDRKNYKNEHVNKNPNNEDH
jgi:hypothetical protein